MEVVDPAVVVADRAEVAVVVDAPAAAEVVQVEVAVVTLPFFCKKHRNQVPLLLKDKK